MTSRGMTLVSLAVLVLQVPAVAGAAGTDQWHISGSNTLRLEHYDVDGDATRSPWPFTGGQYFNEIGLNFTRRVSPYEYWRGQVYGVINDSEYRSDRRGLVPERISLFVEKGDAGIPFRLEAGDFFGYLSYRTLQRSLKGAQLELQPAGNRQRRHSVVLLTGSGDSDWRGLDFGADHSTALSWLVQDRRHGRLGVNLVHNHRDADPATGSVARNQYVASVAGEREFSSASQRITLEGELALFDGEHDGSAGQSRSDSAWFLQLRGRHNNKPLTWRLRYERYGEDYRPAGASITDDRRSAEAHVGWRYRSGLQFRGRLQYFEDNFESANPEKQTVAGVQWIGPLFGSRVDGLSGDLQFYQLLHTDRAGAVDRRSRTLRLDLGKPVGAWHGRLETFLQTIDDRSGSGADRDTAQVTLGATREIRLGGLRGQLAPGVTWRSIDDTTDDWHPSLAMHLERERHSLSFNYGFLTQNRSGAGLDVDTHQLSMHYGYRADRRNSLGLELDLFDRDPAGGAGTEAWRVSAYWTYRFDRAAPASGSIVRSQAAGTLSADPGLVQQLLPGSLVSDQVRRLREANINGMQRLPGAYVFHVNLLDSIDQPQRLVLTHRARRLTKAALVIEFDSSGDGRSASQLYERVREQLIRHYGKPTGGYDKGEFGPDYATAVNRGSLIRITEWRGPDGILRLGIPRRLDGQVRMELQFAGAFPPPRDTRWSIENLR